jgi:single-stranded DNA-binding protein
MNQNVWMGVGRVANKPQLKPYKKADGTEGYRCFFRLAITRLMDRGAKRDEQRASFIPIVAWGDQAKRHAQYLDVGTEICVTGELIVDANKKEDGTYGADFFNVQARDIQYGQPSLKNAGLDVLEKRKATLETRMAEIQAALTAGTPAAGSETPVSTPATGGNPFTPDGQAPASA